MSQTDAELMQQLRHRMDVMEAWRRDMEQVLEELKELNQTARDIATAVRMFIKLSRALGWIAGGVGAAMVALGLVNR